MEMNRKFLEVKSPLVLVLVRDKEGHFQPRPLCVLLPHQVENAVEDIIKEGRWGVEDLEEIYIAPMSSMRLLWNKDEHGINPSKRKKYPIRKYPIKGEL